MLRPVLAAACFLAVAGCATAASPAGSFSYACDAGKAFTAAFTASDRVTVTAGGRAVSMPQVMSGSGARFSDGQATYWSKGRTATLEGLPGGPYIDCNIG
jgi:membrane-bound inhibitor of C-type lysozyme